MSIECMYLFLAPKRQLHSLSKSREVKIELALINFLRIVNVLATAKTIQNAGFATKYLCKYLTMYTWMSYCCRQIIFLFKKNNSFEVWTYIRMEKAARVKFDRKVQRLGRFTILHSSSAIGILSMTFNIHNAMEIRIRHFDGNRNAIGQTIDNNIWARKVTWWWFRSWYGY